MKVRQYLWVFLAYTLLLVGVLIIFGLAWTQGIVGHPQLDTTILLQNPAFMDLLPLILIVLTAGFGLLLWKHHSLVPLPLRTIVAGSVLLSLPFLLIPPLSSNDIYFSLYKGEQVARGIDPYTSQVTEQPSVLTQWFNTTTSYYEGPMPYGPAWGWLMAASMSMFGDNIAGNLLFLRIVFLTVLLTLIFLIDRLIPPESSWRTIGILGLAWNPALIVLTMSDLHMEILLLALLGLAVWLYRKDRLFLSVVFIAIAALFKWFPLLFLPLLFAQAWRGSPTKKTIYSFFGGIVLSLVMVLALVIPMANLKNLPAGIAQQSQMSNFSFFRSQASLFTHDETVYQVFSSSSNPSEEGEEKDKSFILRFLTYSTFLAGYVTAMVQVFRGHFNFEESSAVTSLLLMIVGIQWLVQWYALWPLPFVTRNQGLLWVTLIINTVFFTTLSQNISNALPILLLICAMRMFIPLLLSAFRVLRNREYAPSG